MTSWVRDILSDSNKNSVEFSQAEMSSVQLQEMVMDRNNIQNGSSDHDQLIKYAKALSEVYKSEKNKRKDLEIARKQLLKYADALNSTVIELKNKNKELQEAYLDTIHRLVLAAEYKDPEIGNHIERMSRYSALIAKKLGLNEDKCQNILYAAPMHDVGKIGVADGILMKSTRLTKDEFKVMKLRIDLEETLFNLASMKLYNF